MVITPRSEILLEIERRRLDLNIGLLKVYNYYRVLVGLALLVVASQRLIDSRLGDLDPAWFLGVTGAYTLINLLVAVTVQLLPERSFTKEYPAFALVLFDVFALTWLTYLSGGVGSGLGALILVSIATGSIIVTGPKANVLPALATLAILYEEFFLTLSSTQQTDDYFQAGILGALYFAVALSVQRISRRVRQNDIRALTQAAELADLERVNRQIVHRMRTGIVLIDQSNQIRMANQSARALLGQNQDEELSSLPEPLMTHLMAWREEQRPPGTTFSGAPGHA